ncbi:MAG: hypothetical protein KUG77_20935 [Nannocystaceae bacterium]|nr:hypothetical protein [Nannocystaceae bacterium]
MWLMFGRKSKTHPVKGGRRERRKCPDCDADTTFYEVSVKKTYTAYVVVDLLDTETTAFCCSECHEVMELERTLQPNLSPREKAKLAKANAKAEAERAKAEAKAEAERKKRRDAQARRHRAEVRAQEDALDDDLAAMKSRLGID